MYKDRPVINVKSRIGDNYGSLDKSAYSYIFGKSGISGVSQRRLPAPGRIYASSSVERLNIFDKPLISYSSSLDLLAKQNQNVRHCLRDSSLDRIKNLRKNNKIPLPIRNARQINTSKRDSSLDSSPVMEKRELILLNYNRRLPTSSNLISFTKINRPPNSHISRPQWSSFSPSRYDFYRPKIRERPLLSVIKSSIKVKKCHREFCATNEMGISRFRNVIKFREFNIGTPINLRKASLSWALPQENIPPGNSSFSSSISSNKSFDSGSSTESKEECKVRKKTFENNAQFPNGCEQILTHNFNIEIKDIQNENISLTREQNKSSAQLDSEINLKYEEMNKGFIDNKKISDNKVKNLEDDYSEKKEEKIQEIVLNQDKKISKIDKSNINVAEYKINKDDEKNITQEKESEIFNDSNKLDEVNKNKNNNESDSKQTKKSNKNLDLYCNDQEKNLDNTITSDTANKFEEKKENSDVFIKRSIESPQVKDSESALSKKFITNENEYVKSNELMNKLENNEIMISSEEIKEDIKKRDNKKKVIIVKNMKPENQELNQKEIKELNDTNKKTSDNKSDVNIINKIIDDKYDELALKVEKTLTTSENKITNKLSKEQKKELELKKKVASKLTSSEIISEKTVDHQESFPNEKNKNKENKIKENKLKSSKESIESSNLKSVSVDNNYCSKNEDNNGVYQENFKQQKELNTKDINNKINIEPLKIKQNDVEIKTKPTSVKSKKTTSTKKDRIRFRKYEVDDFNLIKVLGRGSFGKVFLAELIGHNAYFAIKCLKKNVVIEDDDVESIMIERKVLALGSRHPFICKLFCTFQTENSICFVMEYLVGGDLMFHIQSCGKFEESRAIFYAAEVVCALNFLHNKYIIYRDLKLDNILLDSAGHIRLVDFGMCQLHIYREECLPSNFCGTPDYMAPEIIKGVQYNHAVDWWSFGVLIYEMLVGDSPFKGADEDELLWNVCYEKVKYPNYLSENSKNIISLLLEREPEKRLGMPTCPEGSVMQHDFFYSINWYDAERGLMKAPFIPQIKHPSDTCYFDKEFTNMEPRFTPTEKHILESLDHDLFNGFSYTNPNMTD